VAQVYAKAVRVQLQIVPSNASVKSVSLIPIISIALLVATTLSTDLSLMIQWTGLCVLLAITQSLDVWFVAVLVNVLYANLIIFKWEEAAITEMEALLVEWDTCKEFGSHSLFYFLYSESTLLS
jgi:hypothetical protein